MLRKLKNLKNGDVFLVTMPDGEKQQCTMMCQYALRTAKTLTFTSLAHGNLTLPVDTFIDVSGRVPVDKHIAEQYKRDFKREQKKRAGN